MAENVVPQLVGTGECAAEQRAKRRDQNSRRVRLQVRALHIHVHEADLDPESLADLGDTDRHAVVEASFLTDLDRLLKGLPG